MQNYNIQCWDEEHTFVATYIALPSLVFWTVGIPSCSFLILTKLRNKLTLPSIKGKFGFIYNGYNRTNYFWEFVIVYKKICIIAISVFLASISVEV
jgi:hypothetical protein